METVLIDVFEVPEEAREEFMSKCISQPTT